MSADRILILRTSALGDIVHCLPVLTALRRHLPKARLGWVVEESSRPLLEGHADLDEILPVALKRWRRRPLSPTTVRELGAYLRAVERFGPTAVLDLMGNHKAGALAALTFCDRRLGLDRASRREPSSAIWMSDTVPSRGEHAVDHALSVLDALELPREAADFGGEKLFPDAPREVDGRQPSEHSYLLIHPGAGWPNKRLPAERWGIVAARLAEAAGTQVWVVSGPGEEHLAMAAREASGGAAEVVHAGSLAELGALLRHARLVLGGDTGPIHLAHALGTGVLCLMGPTDPRRNGPYGAPERALWHTQPGGICHKRVSESRARPLEIPDDEVVERALTLLAKGESASRAW